MPERTPPQIAACGTDLALRPWRDSLDDEIAADQEYERGLPCAECGEMTYPENYECACPR